MRVSPHRTMVALSGLVIAWFSSSAGASYVVTDLNGINTNDAMCLGISNGLEIAQGNVGSQGHALSWQSLPGAFVDMTPLGYEDAGTLAITGTLGTAGGQVVGYGSSVNFTQDHRQALLWNIRSSNAINLNNASFSTSSTAWGTDGEYQVGSGDGMLALMWHGSANTCVNLTPSGFASAEAHGVYNGYQVGWGSGNATSNSTHALLWHGSATQHWDINPPGKSYSYANGMFGMQAFGEANGHATLWNLNSDGTFTTSDLQPAGFITTNINGDNGTQQVGDAMGASTGYANHAMLWNGSSSSWIDLHQFLPVAAGYVRSGAYGIDANGDVAGWAADASGYNHAILWQAPEPGTLLLLGAGCIALRRRKQ